MTISVYKDFQPTTNFSAQKLPFSNSELDLLLNLRRVSSKFELKTIHEKHQKHETKDHKILVSLVCLVDSKNFG